jgi:hypothetical protein
MAAGNHSPLRDAIAGCCSTVCRAGDLGRSEKDENEYSRLVMVKQNILASTIIAEIILAARGKGNFFAPPDLL